MKNKRILYLLPALIAALSLSGCSKILSLFEKKVTVVSLEKQSLKYSYNDYVNHNIYTVDGIPNKGNPKLLVVPVWFNDSASYITPANRAAVKSHLEKAFFGSADDTGWQSVKSYYQELSNHEVNLTGVVSDWYECGFSSTTYYSEDVGASNTMTLVDKAVDWYLSSSGDSLKSFDTDNNGYMDGVILIYGAPDYATLKNNNAANLWAYCYWLQQERGTSVPVPNSFMWASFDFMYGENSTVTTYHKGDTNFCKLDTHTYIHETGHLFGLMDYYDYSNKYKPAGCFSMQDENVGSHDPYSVLAMGWAKVMIPTETCSLSLKPFQSNHDLVLLKPSNKTINSPFDEYLLVEFYSPTGLNAFDTAHKYMGYYPQGPNKYGIRLWHVDARLLEVKTRSSFNDYVIASEISSSKYYTHVMSNTYYSSGSEDYISPLGKGYADFNLLQLIRNSKTASYHPSDSLSSSDLFLKGDTFSMSKCSKQFVENGKLNSLTNFGWSFKVNSISNEEAIVTFTLN